MRFFAWLKKLFTRRREESPRLGIALGSGGAKGLAHLGALKAFEEEGICFSCVAGSSIGAITGALYAKGYTSSDMVRIIETLNRKEFAKNFRPFADLTFAEEFLRTYLEGDFSTLKLPFAACVTDGENNEGVAFRSGDLARAITASAAIPPFFRGVEIDGKKYYDGAFSNAVPADICRELGAEFVVGIDLSAFAKTEEEKGAFAKILDGALGKITPVFKTADCKTRGYESADVMLRPDLREFRATDVSQAAMDRMFEIGYEEAKAQIPAIKEGIAKLSQEKKTKRKKA